MARHFPLCINHFFAERNYTERLGDEEMCGSGTMDNIVRFHPAEMIFVDAEHLVDLARERGVPRAEFIAFSALEEIAERLSTVEAAWRAGEFRRLAKVARSVVGMSEQLGMQTVAIVAGKVACVAETRDHAALAALVARLVRVGEGSLNAFDDLVHLQR